MFFILRYYVVNYAFIITSVSVHFTNVYCLRKKYFAIYYYETIDRKRTILILTRGQWNSSMRWSVVSLNTIYLLKQGYSICSLFFKKNKSLFSKHYNTSPLVQYEEFITSDIFFTVDKKEFRL